MSRRALFRQSPSTVPYWAIGGCGAGVVLLVSLLPLAGVQHADALLGEAITQWRGQGLAAGFEGFARALDGLGHNPWQAIWVLLLAGGVAHWGQDRRAAAVLLLGMAAQWGLSHGIKLLVARARPPWPADGLATLGASFPSGHATSATVLYGFLAAWLFAQRDLSPRARVLGWLGVGSFVGVNALARVFLGAHFPLDVLGGMLLGSACVVAMWLAWRGD